MPRTIEATYRVVTPLFCTGADNASSELRLPSFKGVLRFWWRALAWPRFSGNLVEVQQCEDRLFGSADGGQSRVHMFFTHDAEDPKLVEKDSVLTIAEGTGETVGQGARYLGYGVMDAFPNRKRGRKAGQLTRACLRAPFCFTVRLLCCGVCERDLLLLRDALIALGTLGGMGAKNRKGYGSLALVSLAADGRACWCAPQSMSELRDAILSLRSDFEAFTLPEYTAFSAETRHVLLSGSESEPLALLDLVGREMVRYRSWGRNGKILGDIESEKKFRDDHDLMKGQRRTKYPRRVAFGLPHNYGRNRKDQVEPFDSSLDRRASPLFIHIHECGTKPLAVLSFLPARFLPLGKSDISVGGSKVRMATERELYCPIEAFLDRLLDRNKRKERFGEAIEVRR